MAANRPVYLAIGIDCDGAKQVLGLWVGPATGESAKFWLTVLSELKSRGVADVCIVCCDGPAGLPGAITVTWPQAVMQRCVVHLIRASLRYASKKHWVPLAKDLKLIYTAADEATAAAALEAFAAAWGDRYPAIVRLWRAHWEQFTPFLAFPPEVRRVIYTTNLIESMNARLRKVTRNRGQFPSEQAALKVLYLAVRNLEEFRPPATITYTDGRTLPGVLHQAAPADRASGADHEKALMRWCMNAPAGSGQIVPSRFGLDNRRGLDTRCASVISRRSRRAGWRLKPPIS